MAPETNKKSILERLPSELIHIICGFLPDHDLGHFRLTNKECAEIGGSHIVRGIHVMFTAKSFQNLLKISRHPVLSRHVTSIFYEARFMEEISREEWEACIRDSDESIDELGRDEKGGFDENLFEERLKISFDKGWKAYELMYEEQEYMRDAKYEFTVFAQALANFPNLKNIQATSDLDFWSEQLRRAYANTFAIRGFMLEGEDVEEKTGVRALSCVAQAISGLPTRIESLRVRRVHWSFFNPAPKGLNLRRHLFTHLRHVDLIVEAEYEDVNDLDLVWMQHEELGLALRSATALESIRLSFGATDSVPQLVLMERSMNIPVSLAPLVGNMTWKNLQDFRVACSRQLRSRPHLVLLKAFRVPQACEAGSYVAYG
jgi:hypothetical protein